MVLKIVGRGAKPLPWHAVDTHTIQPTYLQVDVRFT